MNDEKQYNGALFTTNADGEIIKTISLTQTEQTIEVDITGVKNLLFYLSFTDSSSEAFGFYDLTVSN